MLQEEDKDMYTSRFSKLIANNFNPMKYPTYVKKAKDQIVSSDSAAPIAERDKRRE
jgi:large subunit ribosomal protein L18